MRLISWLDKHFEEFICCVCIITMACCVMLQVLARYVFNVAVHWTEEISSFAMVWAVYMGASLCVRERFHIRILIGVASLPKVMGRFVIMIADFLWAFYCAFMLKISFDYLSVLWKFPAKTPSLGINELYPQSILLIGYLLMLLRLIQIYVNWFRDGSKGLPGMLEDEWAELGPTNTAEGETRS